HRFIETFGGTASYMDLRRAIRDFYRTERRLAPSADTPTLNPGNGWVSRLCFEPAVGVRAIEALLAPHVAAGRLRVLGGAKAVAAEVAGNQVTAVLLQDLDTGATERVS